MIVKSILCPVDFSEGGNAAIAYATSLAKEYEAVLHLVHVHEEAFAYVDGGFVGTPVPPADVEPIRAQLEAVEPDKDVTFLRKFIIGRPSDELVNYAKEEDIDLVVMGTHGRTGLSRLLMGSVAEAVVRKAQCPVLTIKQPENALQESS